MGRLGSPPSGPYAKWVSHFIDLSDRAFNLLQGIEPPDAADLWKSTIFDFASHAETTSIATRTALTYSQSLPALALARIRLEQAIVSSYLIHAPADLGFRRYTSHRLFVQTYDLWRRRETHFKTGKDISEFRRLAEEHASEFLRNGKFERDWTDLSLPDMAKHRDALASSALPWKLEDEYWLLYPIASLAVHAVVHTNLWPHKHFHKPYLDSPQPYLYGFPDTAQSIAATIARFDILQCIEAHSFLTGAAAGQTRELVDAYFNVQAG